MNSKFYKIRDNPNIVRAGCISGDRQVLMGSAPGGIIAFIFDANGDFNECCKHPISFTDLVTSVGNSWPDSVEYGVRCKAAMEDWQHMLGFNPSCAVVRRFFNKELHLGIEDRTENMRDFADDPSSLDGDSRREMEDSIRAWDQAGYFILYWGEEYWLDAEGRIIAS